MSPAAPSSAPTPVHPSRPTVLVPRGVAYVACAALLAAEIGVEARSAGALAWLLLAPGLLCVPVGVWLHRPLRLVENAATPGLALLAGLPALPAAAFACALLAGHLNVHGPRLALECLAVLAALALAVIATGHPVWASPGTALLSGALLGGFALMAAGMSHVQSMRLRAAQAELARRAATQAALADRLARYLPPAVHRAAFEGAAADREGATWDGRVADAGRGEETGNPASAPTRDGRPRRAWLTVCFADLAGFTALTDAAESEEVVAMLDDFYTAMAEAALAHGGTLDKFIGDAAMVFFGAPASAGRAEDARACMAMAAEMQARFDALRRRWRRAGIVRDLALRVGVHSGWCTVGDFGHGARVAWTVIGGAVNTASRLEAAARPGQVLFSRATWLLLGEAAPPCRRRPPLRAKGLPRPVEVFELAPDAAAPVDLEIDGLRVRLVPSVVDPSAMRDVLAAVQARLHGIPESLDRAS